MKSAVAIALPRRLGRRGAKIYPDRLDQLKEKWVHGEAFADEIEATHGFEVEGMIEAEPATNNEVTTD